ncbi:acyl carrier protein [Streptomyces boninensis]|uniref:acyl carrier protein n=1 Tax=Streptomyces boninensis TaxID=2039455 RepID=UPI003B21B1A5
MSYLGSEPDLGDIVGLFRDDLGVELTAREADVELDDLPGWDSMNLLRLIMLVEQGTGRRLPLPDVLQARTVRQLHHLIAHDEAKGGMR